jgi:tight adherence protein C
MNLMGALFAATASLTRIQAAQDPGARILLASSLVSLAIVLVLMGLWQTVRYRALQQRLGAVVSPSHWGPGSPEGSQGFQERVLDPLLRSTLATLGRLTPQRNVDKIRHRLVVAGNPGNLSAIDFLGIQMLAAIGTAAGAVFYLTAARELDLATALLLSLVAGVVGAQLPVFWLQRRIRQRNEAINLALPDALDMLTTMVEAGLGFDAALIRLREKWKTPLTDEFNRAVSEMRMGVRRSDALRHMAERVEVPDLKSFVAVLVQADQLGIPVARILQTQSEQMRIRRRQRAEEAANKLPVKMLPVIAIFIFPALFAVVLGPAIPSLMEAAVGMF